MGNLALVMSVMGNALYQAGVVLDGNFIDDFSILDIFLALGLLTFFVCWVFDLLDWEVDV